MTDFGDWLRGWWRVGKLPYEQGIVRDLVNLAAQQHEALVKLKKRYPRTMTSGAALDNAEAFKEKYSHD